MILKFLLVIAVIAVVYFMFIKPKPLTTKKTKNDTLKDNDMVECAECGIYVEVSEAIISNAKYYCSTACIDKRK